MNRQRYCISLMSYCPYDNSSSVIECDSCHYNTDKHKPSQNIKIENMYYYGGTYSSSK